MKAITILQPFASLIACGAKHIETRSWATKYRGPIAIHAGKSMKPRHMDLAWEEPLFSALAGQHEIVEGKPSIKYPMPGSIIAIADLVDCWKIDGYGHDLKWQPGINDAESKFYYAYPAGIKDPKAEDFTGIRYPETLFGHYSDYGFRTDPRYAWILANIRAIEPIPARGKQRLWEWEGNIV